MSIPPQLQRFVEGELSRCETLVERNAADTLAQLMQPRDGMLNASERQHHFELVDALRKRAPAFQRAFCHSLRSLVLADLAGLGGSAEAPPGAGGGLQLMDEARVESDIEVSRAAQLIDACAEWELRELQTFTSTLAGQKHVSAESNPLRPLAYARSLWEAACAVTPVPVQRGILLRTSAGVMSGQLKMAWAAACTRLESQGVEPGIYRTVVLGAASPRSPPSFDVTQPGALESLLPTMQVGAAPESRGSGRPGLEGGSAAAFEGVLERLEEQIRQSTAAPASARRGTPRLIEHRATLIANATETVDRQIVELLSRLFEAILSDPRLPGSFRALMARLQVSALRVALVDPAMLERHDHPVWALMNRISTATETYPHVTDPRLAGLLAFCEALVDDMARAAVPDAQLYKRSLERLDSFLAEQLREQQQRAQPAVDALRLAERREDLERDISHRLTEQMAPLRTSAPIRRFVTGAWAKVIAEAMLRLGESSEQTVGYLKAVDDLLWSLRLPDHPQSRQRLVMLLPDLLQRLRSGMELIGLPEGERQSVLDELMAVHAEALRPGNAPGQADVTPAELVQRLRDEAVPDTPGRFPFSDSLVDLSSMDTVPADALPDTSGASDDPHRRVDAMAPGNRYRLFLHGAWVRTQLLWRSARGQFFVFSGETPGRTHSITRLALERLSEEKLLTPLEDNTLIQRAVDSLVNKITLTA